jgi:hypothetical protein
MRNAQGLVRSKEFMKASSSKADFAKEKASTSSAKAPYAPKPPKVESTTGELHHMKVFPADEDGNVKVTHHLTGKDGGPVAAPSETHAFDEKQGEEMTNHLMAHAGMPYDSEGGGDHYADEGEETHA